MKKEQIETILEDMLSTGGDFAEVFIEKDNVKTFRYVDSKLDSLKLSNTGGMGLRVAKDSDVYYGASSDMKKATIDKLVSDLNSNIKDKVKIDYVELSRLRKYRGNGETHYSDMDVREKLCWLDKLIRSKDKRISQVELVVQENKQNVVIANYTGRYVSEDRVRTRLFVYIDFKDEDKQASIYYNKGALMGLDLLDTIDYEKVIDETIKKGLDKLYAVPCVGGVMPVVINNGFGGVIIHEACGHAMEATLVADGISVLSNDLGNLIANPCVTVIDDGTIRNEWGTTKCDDEGMETQKNVLIENGVLKSFLVDQINSKKMKHKTTGSGRRESYKYAPTSRMNNTYLAPGNTSVEDMIKSIDFGLYAESLGGGCVAPETGDFNFGCDVAYMIRDGKIAECVKSASLIGNTKEILKEIECVGNDLKLGQGMCGSLSGWVPVNVGQPTIKVGHILVGGEKSER